MKCVKSSVHACTICQHLRALQIDTHAFYHCRSCFEIFGYAPESDPNDVNDPGNWSDPIY